MLVASGEERRLEDSAFLHHRGLACGDVAEFLLGPGGNPHTLDTTLFCAIQPLRHRHPISVVSLFPKREACSILQQLHEKKNKILHFYWGLLIFLIFFFLISNCRVTGSWEHTSLGIPRDPTSCVWTRDHLFSTLLFHSLFVSAFLALCLCAVSLPCFAGFLVGLTCDYWRGGFRN